MNVSYVRGGFIALAVAASLSVAGCGADAEPKAGDKPTASAPSPQQGEKAATESQPTKEDAEPLVVLKGPKGLQLEIGSAERDAGGFLTVKGRLSNASDKATIVPAQLSGDETEVVKHGNSLGGATLVDGFGKKRYYVLRDTDGRPLTTTNLDSLGPGKSTAVFMQFPAPPASTTEVSFQLPTFEPATLKLS
ncbi:hypothetical protein HHL19_08825 [Streptomyces sp. R302]|uniref:hypothetical protein n=1 Tax=unclassified Streptomyces TaxID=2593676 RepID=UPI00145ECD4E|nr:MULTISPECIES: hypothetical protein [unclassified Streptomyces]NML52933.1 hypothetical protein [Streptomyces sp. R301]NML78768.1 hypothetical protein [Streptomyces sp. R302]